MLVTLRGTKNNIIRNLKFRLRPQKFKNGPKYGKA